MKPWFIVGGLLVVLGIAVAFTVDWRFYMLTGHFTPQRIVDSLSSPVVIVSVNEGGLQTLDGRTLPLPGISKVLAPASVAKDVIEHGVEVQPDGTIYALVRVHHWCGNDPVRFHLARIDLSSLLLVLEELAAHGHPPDSDPYGVDPGLTGMAGLPHEELKELFETPTRR